MNTCGCAGKGFEFCGCQDRAAIAQPAEPATVKDSLTPEQADAQPVAPKPDGRLHQDGYFTWASGVVGYVRDKCLPCDFWLKPAAAPPARQPQWMPIETAPKDGSMFVCWVAAERWSSPDGEGSGRGHDVSQVDLCWWRPPFDGVPESDYFDNASGQVGDSQAVTHWMPLPPPPGGIGREGE